MSRFRDPEPIAADHDLEAFDCGVPSLNRWVVEHACQAAAVGSARTFVIHDEEQDRVVGYHAVTVASIAHRQATVRTAKGMPKHPIPAALLARLAVDSSIRDEASTPGCCATPCSGR